MSLSRPLPWVIRRCYKPFRALARARPLKYKWCKSFRALARARDSMNNARCKPFRAPARATIKYRMQFRARALEAFELEAM